MKTSKFLKALLSSLLLMNFCIPSVIHAEENVRQPVIKITEEEKQRMREQGELSRQSRQVKMNEKAIGPSTGYIDLVYVSQGSNAYFCGPASASMILKTVANDNTSQSTLAREMGTTSAGTYVDDIFPVLNDHLGDEVYDFYNYSQGSDLIGDIINSIDMDLPVIYDIKTNSQIPGYSSGISHYIVGNGYDANSNYSMDTLTYNDPNGNNGEARGEHTLDYSIILKALNANAGGYYIAKAWNY